VSGRRSPVLDAGVQLERTSLSWRRTALGFAVVGALALRHGIETTSVLAFVAGGLLMLGSIGTNAYEGWAYGRRAVELRAGRPILRTWAPRTASALLCLAALAVLVAFL
jgi:uncharacterized membrane protein YidH (DUF202 family)